MRTRYANLSDIIGKIFIEIKNVDDRELILRSADGETYKMYHEQDCCEDVSIDDICGNLSDLLGFPITMAEEESNREDVEWGSCTWTFYKLATVKGYVTIRWYGESNGYYSESVDFIVY